MLYVYSADVKEGKLDAYQDWLQANHARIVKESPTGWRYEGTYLPVFGFGSHLSEIHWEIESYAAFDKAVEACEKREPYCALIEEWYKFLDVSDQKGRLLKRAEHQNTFVAAQ